MQIKAKSSSVVDKNRDAVSLGMKKVIKASYLVPAPHAQPSGLLPRQFTVDNLDKKKQKDKKNQVAMITYDNATSNQGKEPISLQNNSTAFK